MKRYILSIVLCCGLHLGYAQQQQEMMIITTVEYMDFLDGSFSKMYVNYPDGKTEEIDLKGLWSFGRYISEKKVKANDKIVMNKINELLKMGWKIAMVSSSTQPRTSEANASPSSILTRYILIR